MQPPRPTSQQAEHPPPPCMLYVLDPLNKEPVPTGFFNLRTSSKPEPGGPNGSQPIKHLVMEWLLTSMHA